MPRAPSYPEASAYAVLSVWNTVPCRFAQCILAILPYHPWSGSSNLVILLKLSYWEALTCCGVLPSVSHTSLELLRTATPTASLCFASAPSTVPEPSRSEQHAREAGLVAIQVPPTAGGRASLFSALPQHGGGVLSLG